MKYNRFNIQFKKVHLFKILNGSLNCDFFNDEIYLYHRL